ncbi:hypothetical protein FHG87_008358 [Trinorchestia longiramus]|nr:hypothetical protein FHG87_008358 [Trinorchestia longiramus]
MRQIRSVTRLKTYRWPAVTHRDALGLKSHLRVIRTLPAVAGLPLLQHDCEYCLLDPEYSCGSQVRLQAITELLQKYLPHAVFIRFGFWRTFLPLDNHTAVIKVYELPYDIPVHFTPFF